MKLAILCIFILKINVNFKYFYNLLLITRNKSLFKSNTAHYSDIGSYKKLGSLDVMSLD